MRIISTSKIALILTAVFLSCCVGAAADDDPSTSPSSTASPVLLSKGDKTPSEVPSMDPSASPSKDPSAVPSIDPSETPTMSPSESPSSGPSQSINPSDSPTMSPSSSMSPTRDFEEVDGYEFIDYGYCLDADGHKYNSISVPDKLKPSECGEGCGGCFWHIPEYVGFDYFLEDLNTGVMSSKCSCLFESSITRQKVVDSTTCLFDHEDNFDFNNSGQGEIVAGDSTDEKRDYRTCYSRQSIDPSEFPTSSPSFSLSPTTAAEKFIKIFNHTGTVQRYTIPEDSSYTFTAVGAKGGDCDGCDKATCKVRDNWCYKCDAKFHEGGYGTLVRRTFYLRKGDQIEVLVGGRGENCRKIRKYKKDFQNDDNGFPDIVDDRDYLEGVAGAGGGGATSVRVKYAADGKEDLLLIAGGGGGAAKFYHGEDGEVGQSGGWEWGGRDGQGGGLPNAGTFAALSGAGGGGVYGNGDSTRSSSDSSMILAEGGKSLSNGGQGGFLDYTYSYTLSGGAGGYGSGGQGGIGDCAYYESNGGGGGGGGYSGGGAGPGGGNGAAGGGSLGYYIEGHIGGDDGYLMMENVVGGYEFIDYGYCLDADGHKFNSISVLDKFTGKSSECGEGCKGCFWTIPEYVGFNYFFMEDPETGEVSKKCSCLFESGISQKELEKKTTCSFDDDAFDFIQSGQGEIVAGDSTDEKRDYRTCYSRQATRFDYKGPIFQYYTVEEDAWFGINAVGAQGGNCIGGEYPKYKRNKVSGRAPRELHRGGLGALSRGQFYLEKGDRLRIVVGEQGEDCACAFYYEDEYELKTCTGAGGGGASYVQVLRKVCIGIICTNIFAPIVIAGGGGGSAQLVDGLDGQDTEDGGGLTYRVCKEGEAKAGDDYTNRQLCEDRVGCYGSSCIEKSFGGESGKGGELGPETRCNSLNEENIDYNSIGGGGGGGVHSDGGIHCNGDDGTNIRQGQKCKDDYSNAMTMGGSRIASDELPYGGFVYRAVNDDDYVMASGGRGGFGGGAQGGASCYGSSLSCCNGIAARYGAGGGGGGGYGGGAAGSIGGVGGSGGGGGSVTWPEEDFVFDTLKVAGAGKEGGHGYVNFEIIRLVGVVPGVGGPPGGPGIGGPGESKAGKRPKSLSQTSKSDVGDSAKKKKGKSEREEEDSLFA